MSKLLTPSPLSIRRMTLRESGLVRDWANDEGWNPGLHDQGAFHAADPHGFFVGLVENKPASCVSCVRYGDDFGFLGQYIVRPEYRSRGFGLATWNAGMAHLAGRNVGLDGVLDQVKNYERSAFRFAQYHVRFAGIGGGNRPAGLMPIDQVPFAEIADYDRRCFPAPRDAFLREWLKLPESTCLAVQEGNAFRGYGAIRRCMSGFKVGPLFADNVEIAARLLTGLVAAIPGQPFSIDMPESRIQRGSIELAQAFKLNEVFRTARMYTKGEPAFDRDRVFGITTLELG